MGFKRSLYTRDIDLDGDAGLFYNGRSGALLQLSAGARRRARTLLGDGGPLSEDASADALFPHLRAGEFIVPAELDELALLGEQYERERRRSKFLLTLFPTFGCNLGCDYCFVGRKSGALSRAAQDAILDFTARHLAETRVPSMGVDWLGGEPMLALPIIERLSTGFLGLCDAAGIPYSAQVITNGTLTSEEAVGTLLRCGVDRLQVTIDGPRELHDRRRPFKILPRGAAQRSSFDQILGGLERLIDRFTVRLRINVDRDNLPHVWPLLDTFAERGWLGPDRDFFPYLSRVAPFTSACASVVDRACDMDDFYDVQLAWIERLFELGVPVAFQGLYQYPSPRLYNCGAVGSNGFIFNAAGEIHKCGLAADEPEEAVGQLGGEIDTGGSTWTKWATFSPLENAACRRCAYLPTCLGGCPRDQIEQRTREKAETCRFHKQFEDRLIALHVRLAARAQAQSAPQGSA